MIKPKIENLDAGVVSRIIARNRIPYDRDAGEVRVAFINTADVLRGRKGERVGLVVGSLESDYNAEKFLIRPDHGLYYRSFNAPRRLDAVIVDKNDVTLFYDQPSLKEIR